MSYAAEEPREQTMLDMQTRRLLAMLTYRREHGSKGERKFYERFIETYEPHVFADQKGEVAAYVLTTDPDSRVLFSSHIDTQHRGSKNDVFQKILYDASMDHVFRPENATDCLGADDAAGVWMLLELYDAGVPGTYIFHRGEEKGGIGSSVMDERFPEFLKQFDYAIAFDRKDTCSIITEQSVGRTASDEFAWHLAALLNDDGMDATTYELKPDNGGIFTDTANYVDHISECTNISAGYYFEHTRDEYLDVAYLRWLREQAIRVFSSNHQLPAKRALGREYNRWSWTMGGLGWDDNRGTGYLPKRTKTDPDGRLDFEGVVLGYRDIIEMSTFDLQCWVAANDPADVADCLMDLAEEVRYMRRGGGYPDSPPDDEFELEHGIDDDDEINGGYAG